MVMTHLHGWMASQLFELEKHIQVVLDASLPNEQQNKAAKEMARVYFYQAQVSINISIDNFLKLQQHTEE